MDGKHSPNPARRSFAGDLAVPQAPRARGASGSRAVAARPPRPKARRFAFATVLAAAGLAASIAAAPDARPGSTALRKAAERYWEFLKQEDLSLRTRLGLPLEKLPDLSLAKAQRDAAFGRSLLGDLQGVREPALSQDEKLSLAILRREAGELTERPKFYWLTFPATPYTFQFLGVHSALASVVFREPKDTGRYLQLLAAYPRLIRSLEEKLREQARQGIRISRQEIPLVTASFGAAAESGPQNPLGVRAERLSVLSPAEREAFEKELAALLKEKVGPAIGSLIGYLSGAYREKAPEAVGLSQYPGGADFYRVLVRRSTTLDVSPEEIHRRGLAEIERLNGELEAVRKKVRFDGDLAGFRTFLKTDTRFFAKSPEEVGERLMAAQRRILPKVPAFFGRVPRAPFGVQRLEPELEGAMTFGYYQTPTASDPKGYYRFNGSRLSERSLLAAGSLVAHELVPGHHFQINLQRENQALPEFRRESFYTAFTEGWGEYASTLAGEMGMYADPYDLAGRLAADLFLTSRLVVDTGMNLLGWPRSRAVEFLRRNTLLSDAEIETETLRYSCDLPAQALAYKMGSWKIVEVRERAKRALGASFDIRKFHDAVLEVGSIPLDVLERHIDWFVAQQKQK